MITWTKIDIGDGEAIWYSDCLQYQIYREPKWDVLYAIYFDGEPAFVWYSCLERAVNWCEEHKAKLTKRG